MARYLMLFDDGTMDIPAEEMAVVGQAAHEVVFAAMDAGVWIFGGGLESQRARLVGPDGLATDGPYSETREVIGGFLVVDVPSWEEALVWTGKFATACRCAQEVREIMTAPLIP